jgi:hypothetical protein
VYQGINEQKLLEFVESLPDSLLVNFTRIKNKKYSVLYRIAQYMTYAGFLREMLPQLGFLRLVGQISEWSKLDCQPIV